MLGIYASYIWFLPYISKLAIFASIVYFLLLPLPEFNESWYISERALLPEYVDLHITFRYIVSYARHGTFIPRTISQTSPKY